MYKNKGISKANVDERGFYSHKKAPSFYINILSIQNNDAQY